jgi:hypothetical protein
LIGWSGFCISSSESSSNFPSISSKYDVSIACFILGFHGGCDLRSPSKLIFLKYGCRLISGAPLRPRRLSALQHRLMMRSFAASDRLASGGIFRVSSQWITYNTGREKRYWDKRKMSESHPNR